MSILRKRRHGWVGLAVFALIESFAAAQEPSSAGAPPAAPTAAKPTAAKPTAAKPTAQSEAGEPRVTVSPPAARGRPGSAKGASAADRLDLNTATVTGDREQPKVLYIVPWKSADIGDVSGKPMNSLLDEALAPVDRDEFKREVVYYNAVASDAAKSAGSKPGTPQGEK